MTHNDITTSNTSIERRTLIGLLGSGMATLAGCFEVTESDNPDSDGEESDESTATGNAPEERSQYIESTEIVAAEADELALEVSVVDSYDWIDIELLTEGGENYSQGGFDAGETETRVPLTESVEHLEPVPSGEHTLLLDTMEFDAEVPFTLSTQMELVEAVPGSSREELSEGSLGLVFRNTGPHADATARTIVDGDADELEYTPIPPGETGLAEIDAVLRDDTIQCDDNQGIRNEEYTVEFLWSNSLTVSVPIEYTDGTPTPCERSLAGSATVVSGDEGSE